jgi:hypothetical protein
MMQQPGGTFQANGLNVQKNCSAKGLFMTLNLRVSRAGLISPPPPIIENYLAGSGIAAAIYKLVLKIQIL